MTASGAADGHTNHYEPMMEPPGVHFDSSNYSVLPAMDTQSSGMLQQNFDAHVRAYSFITISLSHRLLLFFSLLKFDRHR